MFKIIVTWLVSLQTVVGDKLRATRATRNQREEEKGEPQRRRKGKWEATGGEEREGRTTGRRGMEGGKRKRPLEEERRTEEYSSKRKGRIFRRRGKRNHRYIEMSKRRGKERVKGWGWERSSHLNLVEF